MLNSLRQRTIMEYIFTCIGRIFASLGVLSLCLSSALPFLFVDCGALLLGNRKDCPNGIICQLFPYFVEFHLNYSVLHQIIQNF